MDDTYSIARVMACNTIPFIPNAGPELVKQWHVAIDELTFRYYTEMKQAQPCDRFVLLDPPRPIEVLGGPRGG